VKKIYLALGSNLGNREQHLQACIDAINAPDLRVTRTSSTYETAPRDYTDQPWFLNLVLECETELFPLQLLRRLQRIEKQLGRQRVVSKGPRTIDIDILLFGNFLIERPLLQVPHPRMAERRFVLEPLAELAPELRHPVTRRSIKDLLANTKEQALRKASWTPTIFMAHPQ
jgi:2-amino-4-hydroxy-6-hydroxymethyldihydropteridine diphosphokinase